MRQFLTTAAIAIAILAAVAVLWRQDDPAVLHSMLSIPSREQLYPPAPPMPIAVSGPVEDLLATYENSLRGDAPAVLAALQPGLSDAEIDQLEQEHGVKLTADLRALYRWRNGTPRFPGIAAFPNHEFVPLEDALARRDAKRREAAAQSPEQRALTEALVGHEKAWIEIIIDLAGDGYYFDPGRSEAEGSFFFHFRETGSYVFYPRFTNFLAAVVEGQNAGIFVARPHGVDTSDFEKAHRLMLRFGAEPPR